MGIKTKSIGANEPANKYKESESDKIIFLWTALHIATLLTAHHLYTFKKTVKVAKIEKLL